jgi:undecaprenyl-diphosphatase
VAERSSAPKSFCITACHFFAERLIWAIPILIGISWLRGREETRKAMLIATASGLLGLLINQIIGLVWLHPRPFMIGLGHTLIPHVADSSFPSDHLTLWWAVTFSLAMQRGPRMAGLILAPLGIPIAWARIYLGVHFPFDMFGAVIVAWLSVAVITRSALVFAAKLSVRLLFASTSLWPTDCAWLGAQLTYGCPKLAIAD